ncbi:MAG: MFS transporter [Thermoflexales bacterium]|nr:MFS transporter [Thermoflexales bacterium]
MTVNFLLALIASAFFFAGFQALFPTLPLYVEHLGGGAADNGLVTLAFTATAVISRPYIGGIADRGGRKPMLLVGALIFTLAPLWCAASDSVAMLAAARAFQGLGIAAFTTAFQALIVDMSPPDKRGQWLGLSANATALALVVGPLAGDAILARFGFTVLFVMAALSALVSALVSAAVRPPVSQQRRAAPFWTGLREVLVQRGLYSGLLGMSLLGVVFGVFMTFIPRYALDFQLGAPGSFFTAYALAMLAIQPIAGGLSDRTGRARVAVPGLALAGLAVLLLAGAHTSWTALSATFLYGLAAGAARVAIDGMVADSVLPHQRATAAALQFTCFDLCIGLGSALLGPVAQAGSYPAMYAIAGALVAAGALPFWLLTRRRHLTKRIFCTMAKDCSKINHE